MQPDSCERFRAHWPAVRTEWLELLRGEPVLSPLGRPDTLVFLMDATLLQLLTGLRTAETAPWLRHCLPLGGSVYRHCACGLNPLLKYFTTGELALRAVCGQTLAKETEEILALFRLLAQHDLDSLCSLCQHPEWIGCALRPRRAPAQSPP